MMRPVYYATDSVLHRLNPLNKVIAIMPLLIFLTFVTNLWVHLFFIMLHMAVLLMLGRIPPRRLARSLTPLLLTLIGFFVFYAPFVMSELVARSPLLFTIGPLEVRLARGLVESVNVLASAGFLHRHAGLHADDGCN